MSKSKLPGGSQQRNRENADPDESVRPLPWFLVMFLGAMAMWGGFYIYITPSGEDSSYGDQRTVETLRPPVPVAAGGGAVLVDGKLIYGGKCAACHQATGLGVAGVFPPLAASEWVTGDEKILTHILLHGIVGEIEVKGVVYKGAMPAWQSMSDDELAGVMTYIRGEWGNQAAPITAETVKIEREATKARTAPYNGGAERMAAMHSPPKHCGAGRLPVRRNNFPTSVCGTAPTSQRCCASCWPAMAGCRLSTLSTPVARLSAACLGRFISACSNNCLSAGCRTRSVC
jgi:mono/diheme cytochrome c family protein